LKPETTEDVVEILQGYILSASLGTAMELGLFWLLDESPLVAPEIARSLNIPLNRCHYWLQILCKFGLLEESDEGYALSTVAQEAILNALSQETWAFQAREERDSSLSVQDLALNINRPMSSWQTRNMTQSDKIHLEQSDPSYVERFTRKLYEIHISLAEEVASLLDLRGVKSLLDLGGGSGVISFALLRKSRELTSVVVDFEKVCQVGREIASENGLEKRISYLASDFLIDDLPGDFDMVMLCDVGSDSEMLFRKIFDVLNPGGRLVIVDKFAPSRAHVPPSRLPSRFLYSLEYPSQSIELTTMEMVRTRLHRVGFRKLSVASVPHKDNLPWNIDWSMLEAAK
jgi:cyclopropane fatty-acyl-phospholipid synthase-like methyltransferase